MNVLIADDEQIEREGLKAMLLRAFPDLKVALAKNGAAAVETARECLPDLVLMDIKMPGMSGLEAAERIKEELPETRFIMVTAYETFEYARTAIRIGVEDYLLKPSRAAEITETVGRVLDAIRSERRDKLARRETEDALRRVMPIVEADVVTQLLYDRVHEVHLDELVRMIGGASGREAFVMLLALRGEAASMGGGAPGDAASDAFGRSLRGLIRKYGGGWIGALSGRQMPLIVFREPGRSYRAQASGIAHHLLALRTGAAERVAFVGIGLPYASLGDIRLSYQEALIASADTGLPARQRFYEDLPALVELKDDYPAKQDEKSFIEHIRCGRWDQVQSRVEDYIGRYERNGFGLVLAGQRMLEALWVVHRVLAEIGIEAEKPIFSFRAEDYRQLRAEAEAGLGKLIRSAESYRSRIEPDAALRMKRYIDAHASEELSLERIAAHLGMSPYHLSKLFKEETGMNYIDYLTQCRIDKAKELLADQARSLKEIAIDVGYSDPNYFSKVFKKVCGLAPTDYRRTLLGKKV